MNCKMYSPNSSAVRLMVMTSLLLFAVTAHADWFLSDEIKAEIVKAKSGDVSAQMKVALAYDTGRGAPKNLAQATNWYTQAASQGDANAQNSLGSVFQESRDYSEAIKWYQKAADQNLPLAVNNLAYMHDLGLGVPQNRKIASEYYLKAANLGWAQSMWNLTIMYASGQLGEKDLQAACVWSNRALNNARLGETKLKILASRAIPEIERALTDLERADCRKQYEGWIPSAQVAASIKQ